MLLVDLLLGDSINLQLSWGEQSIEFVSRVIGRDDKGIYVTPYLHNGKELEINIDYNNRVSCHVYADSPLDKSRVTWKNVELSSVTKDGKPAYYIRTNGYNFRAKQEDRRTHDRVIIRKKGSVFDAASGNDVTVVIHDISDIGISFYAPLGFAPQSQQIVVKYSDTIGERSFDLKLDCIVTRTRVGGETQFFGCRLIGNNKDFLLYSFLIRLYEKKRIKEGISGNDIPDEDEEDPAESKELPESEDLPESKELPESGELPESENDEGDSE